MRFTVHNHPSVLAQLSRIVKRMKAWNAPVKINSQQRDEIANRVVNFGHTTKASDWVLAGVDGSGDFPSLAYEDSFIYFTTADVTVYEPDLASGLKELNTRVDPIYALTWLPEETKRRGQEFDRSFESMTGMTLADVMDKSDYKAIKQQQSGQKQVRQTLIDELIRPHAHDAGNIGIQFRSTAELSAVLRAIDKSDSLKYILYDGTFSLPMASRSGTSLFFEHVKRLCCVKALQKGVGFFALSKSPGLPSIDTLEEIIAEQEGLEPNQVAEHWYLRLPDDNHDPWTFPLTSQRNIPPPSAMTYLFRLHRTTPVMRLDMDERYWSQHLQSEKDETAIFEMLDYASHDQRCYGYPYPIKSAHDRVSLTQPERVALRKSIIEEAVKTGMKRKLFIDSSMATGHR